ncbi:DNA adenine methylase [Huintestinicola sp.]|uniref:DNA adenine methylase n=1 Tax=Huintestinicola sp. TaxID=2981661 RepID=UPI003D7C8059
MRYIGGKNLLLENINNVINDEIPNISSVIDLFAGSGVVSNNFKSFGYRTISNDFLYFSYVISTASIKLNKKPPFKNLGISDPIKHLNDLTIADTEYSVSDCFIYNNYSPVGDCNRMYFQPENAMKIDIIRLTIEKWYKNNLITEDEYFYLLASLINAVPFVANITGVYAAYLKFWDERTYKKLELTAPVIISNGKKNECFNTDYTNLLSKKCDLLYADPPYNSREYLPNYHILETIARYDYPEIHGVTGMRNYDDQKSVFCKKNTVASAFETMIRDCQSKYILISYNNEALLSTEELSEICRKYAVGDSFKLFEYDYRRYKNKIPNNSNGLKEQLYLLRRR